MTRKIIHLDMDAFFAAVEQRDNPALRGKPVIVGGDPSARGVVSTCSYEARRLGVHSAMPAAQARKLCPNGIFLRPRFAVYRRASVEICAIMCRFSETIEPLSLDEAYLDVSASRLFRGSATRIAEALRAAIYRETGLTASAGISYNKMLAKIASDLNKPNGIAVIPPEAADAFIGHLPVARFHGIGKATAARLNALGIHTGADLRAAREAILTQHFGKRGKFYHQVAHGVDLREVTPSRVRKSVGSELTFVNDLSDSGEILAALFQQNRSAFAAMADKSLGARTLTIKIKYRDFSQITRTRSIEEPFPDAESAHDWIHLLYADTPQHLPVRLVGVTYSGLQALTRRPRQPALF